MTKDILKGIPTDWIELAHESKGHIYPTAIYWLSAQHVSKQVGVEDGVTGCWYKDGEFSYLVTKGAFSKAGEKILEKLKKEPGFLEKIVEVNHKEIPVVLEAAEKLSGKQLSELSEEELLKRWNDWFDSFMRLMTWSAMGTMLEMEEPLLSKELEELLSKKLGKRNEKIGEHFQLLTTSTEPTVAKKEELDLLNLRLEQLSENISDQDISEHTKKYSWIAFGYDGPGWTKKDTEERLLGLPDKTSEIENLIKEKKNSGKKLEKDQARIEKELKLNDEEKRLFNILRVLGFWKFERKFQNQKGHEMVEDFIKEIARRNDLTLEEAKMIAPNEIEQVLLENRVDKKALDERLEESLVIFKGLDYVVISGKETKPVLETIEKALSFDPRLTELHGSTAYPGKAIGVVRHINSPKEMSKMNQDDILVSTSTSPDILPAMKKAGAIITDSGGITCHAAIIAREIKVPTLVGTKTASKILKEGTMVDVDTSKGIARIIDKKQLEKEKSKKWFVWEKIRRMCPMHLLEVFAYMNTFSEPGKSFSSGIKFENRNIELLSIEEDFLECGRLVADYIIPNPKWFAKNLDTVDEKAVAYFKAANELLALDFKNKSNEELLQFFEKLYSAYVASHKSGVLSTISDFRENFLSAKIHEFLSKKLAEKKLDISPSKAFALLSQMRHKSILAEERAALLELIDKVLENKELEAVFRENDLYDIMPELEENFPDFFADLEQHWKKFQWIFFMYEGPALPKSYFVKQIKEGLDTVNSIRKEFEGTEKLLALQEKLLKRICDNENERFIFSFPRRLIETKGHRKDAMYFGCFVMERLFAEVAKRLNITPEQVRYMQEHELVDALQGRFSDFDLLTERIKYSVFVAIGGERKFLVGKEAKAWYTENVIVEEFSDSNELEGATAFPGKVKGKVKVINHPNEIFKMEKGNILVSHATNPNLLPAMDMAGAIVTDVGGLTCHAAIVSREFKIPCIVGTKIATQLLKDDDLVEVDAEKGIVKKSKVV